VYPRRYRLDHHAKAAKSLPLDVIKAGAVKPLRLEEARVTVHEHPRRRHCIAGTGGAGGTGDVACAAGASSAYQERPVLALSGHTNRADECDFEGYDRHDADVTRCLLMTQSRHRRLCCLAGCLD
jgi:hypothetical protein